VDQSHGGSSAQARAVNDGLQADVVTMNTTSDVDFLASNGVVAKDWAKKFPHNAAPTTSTMLFITRNGNPKGIKDWDDLIKPGVQVIVAENPVAVVERTTAKKGSGELAKAYLDYLYSDEAQEIAAKHAMRPRNPAVLKKYSAVFKPISLFQVSDYFGSLTEAQKVHLNF
jgi:ABC-type sulfate transport system substrate-binding protein